jgi:hypothetical protein
MRRMRSRSVEQAISACVAMGLVEHQIRELGDFVDVEFYRPVTESIGS